jgi:hypothetical protein
MTGVALLGRPEADRHDDARAGATSPRRERVVLGVALVVASAVTALGLRGHTMWFDELQAWNIARASHSVGDVYAALRYEGHPIVWYLPLFVITRFTGDPHAMQVLQWAIATGTFALVLFRAPFTIGMRIAVVAGYFFAFEYGVISRSYGLSALLLILAVTLLARPRPAWMGAGVALGVLAWTSLPGAVFALAVAGAVFLGDRARLRWSAVVTVVAAGAAITCVPPSDFSSFAPGLVGDGSIFGPGRAAQVASAASGLWRGLVPVPDAVGKWNSNIFDGLPGAGFVEAALAVAVFVVVLRALRTSPFARRLWWIGAAGYFVFFLAVILPEQSRYAGYLLLLFLACVWLAVAPPGAARVTVPDPLDRRRTTLGACFAFVVVAQIVAMVAIYPVATVDAFSRDEALAGIVHHARLDDAIVSGQDWDAATIGGYLDRPVYSAARGAWIRYFIHDDREAQGFEHLTDRRVVCAAAHVAATTRGPVAIVTDHHMHGLPLLGSSEGGYVYRFAPTASGVASGC